ncbi:uncharacterized protein [Palaemon carinicauda]|uniref:uncharacterized protein n=1 Tax=Palaemon carinicauda TaxID=392227 RepID=UPI0035B613A0
MTTLSRKFVVVAALDKEVNKANNGRMLQLLRGVSPLNPSADLVLGCTKDVATRIRQDNQWRGSIALQDFAKNLQDKTAVSEMRCLGEWVVLDGLDNKLSSRVLEHEVAVALQSGFKVIIRLAARLNRNKDDSKSGVLHNIQLIKEHFKTFPHRMAIAFEVSCSSSPEKKNNFLKETRETLAEIRLWLSQNTDKKTSEQIPLLFSIPEHFENLGDIAQVPDLDGIFAARISSSFEVIRLIKASKNSTKMLWKRYQSVKVSTALIKSIRQQYFQSKFLTECRCPKRYISMV